MSWLLEPVNSPTYLLVSEVILGMDHNLDFLKSHLHENTQSFINYNLKNDLFPVIAHPTHITHSTATLIDNIFLESRLTGQMTSKILIDDISDHIPCVTIIGNLLPSKAFKRTITSPDIRLETGIAKCRPGRINSKP